MERIRAEKEELIKQGKIKRDKKESIIFKGADNSYYEKIGDKIKNIDDEIPFELPDGWGFVRLKELWELISGRDLSPSEYNADVTYGAFTLIRREQQFRISYQPATDINEKKYATRFPVNQKWLQGRTPCSRRSYHHRFT